MIASKFKLKRFINCNRLIILSKRKINNSIIKYNEFIVSEDYANKRLDTYLSEVNIKYSRSFYSSLCEKGYVTVNQKPRSKAHKVAKGDVINFIYESQVINQTIAPENIPLEIIYEDEHLICINKPCGMVVHPAPGSPNGTFVNALLHYLGSDAAFNLIQSQSTSSSSSSSSSSMFLEGELDSEDLPETPEAAAASPRHFRPGVVHRLDKGTSGVLIAGKHPEAVAKLSKLFATRQIEKIYLAVCIGHPGEASIVESIGKSATNRQMMAVYDGPPGKLAVTHVKTLAFDGKMSACLIRIETGR
jgi:23S rRNA pseudouridine1911/1915/1917 synthase